MHSTITAGNEAISHAEAQDAPVLEIVNSGETADLALSGATGGSQSVDTSKGRIKIVSREPAQGGVGFDNMACSIDPPFVTFKIREKFVEFC